MTVVEHIIQLSGGTAALAEALSITPGAVRAMRRTGISGRHHHAIHERSNVSYSLLKAARDPKATFNSKPLLEEADTRGMENVGSLALSSEEGNDPTRSLEERNATPSRALATQAPSGPTRSLEERNA